MELATGKVRARVPLLGGRRGFFISPRSSFGSATLSQHVETQDAAATVIAMIADPDTLDCLDSGSNGEDRRRGSALWKTDRTRAFQKRIAPKLEAGVFPNMSQAGGFSTV